MERYFIEVSYVGDAFHGSQLQGELPTVQRALNKALSTILKKETATFGASRTDEGVHAVQNFYHFDEEAALSSSFLYNLNALLPHGISVKSILRAKSLDANARFDAVSRSYRYKIYRRKNPFLHHRAYYYPFALQIDALNDLAAVFLHHHDFASFSKRNTQSKTTLCNITESRWEQHGEEWHYVVTANRFLRGMVRGLVATQLRLAKGNAGTDLPSVLAAKDCTKAWFSVPGHGLYLEQIIYPKDLLERL